MIVIYTKNSNEEKNIILAYLPTEFSSECLKRLREEYSSSNTKSYIAFDGVEYCLT